MVGEKDLLAFAGATWREDDILAVVQSVRSSDAVSRDGVADGTEEEVAGAIERIEQLGKDVFQVPAKRFAFQSFFDGQHVVQRADVAEQILVVGAAAGLDEDVFVLVHPDVGRAQLVVDHIAAIDGIGATRPVGGHAEDMADVGTGMALQGTAAQPDAKRDVHFLAAILFHVGVIAADFKEKLAVDGEKAASHDGRGHGGRRVGSTWSKEPLLAQAPSEAQDINASWRHVEGIAVDGVDDWHDHVLAIFGDAVHQGLQPHAVGFDVGVEKGQRVAGGDLRSL